MTLAQIIASLTKGYIKKTGRQPFGLDKLRIKMEAAEKLRQMNKIVKFPQNKSFMEQVELMKRSGDIADPNNLKKNDNVLTREMFQDSNLNKVARDRDRAIKAKYSDGFRSS